MWEEFELKIKQSYKIFKINKDNLKAYFKTCNIDV
jgi:hypothetical protein